MDNDHMTINDFALEYIHENKLLEEYEKYLTENPEENIISFLNEINEITQTEEELYKIYLKQMGAL